MANKPGTSLMNVPFVFFLSYYYCTNQFFKTSFPVHLPQLPHQPQCQVQCPTTDPWNALKMARVAPAVAQVVGWEITTTAVIARVEKAARVPT